MKGEEYLVSYNYQLDKSPKWYRELFQKLKEEHNDEVLKINSESDYMDIKKLMTA